MKNKITIKLMKNYTTANRMTTNKKKKNGLSIDL